MKKLILFIVLACVSCFAYSQMPVEFRHCKMISNYNNVMISCKIYNDDYAQTGETGYMGSYYFTSDKNLDRCKESISVDNTKNYIVNSLTGDNEFVEHSVYDKYGVRIESENMRIIKNFCANTYKKVIKYVD